MSHLTAISLRIILCVLSSGAAFRIASAQEIRISTDFPGGNIVVERLHGDTVWLKPDSENTEGTWFYWYFRIAGVAGRTITFQFTQNNVLARFGPVYSINNPDHWRYLGEQSYAKDRFRYSFGQEDTVAWFAMAMPYTQEHLEDFLANLRNVSLVKKGALCSTRQGRVVEELLLEPVDHPADYKVLITARHHACEMMANYVLEGIVQSICNERDLQFLLDRVAFRIIPFMDKDGVENGDQGKNRIPRDHNRDYDSVSIYNTTSALREQIPGWADNKMQVALDLHCPWIRNNYNEWIYMVGAEAPDIQDQQEVFSRYIERHAVGELRYRHEHFLAFGKAWNTSNNYSKGKSFAAWAQGVEGVQMAGTLEFPYANVLGTAVTKDNARVFGRAIAYAIQDYLLSLAEMAD
jgi:hypothetical protein